MQVQFQLGESTAEASARNGYIAVCVLLMTGLLSSLWRRRSPMELFALTSLVVSLFYFSFVDRLMLPIYIIAFAASVDSFSAVLRLRLGQRMTTGLIGFCLIVWIGADLAPRAGWEQIQRTHEWYNTSMTKLSDVLPPDARLASMRGMHYGVHLGCPVFNLRFGVERARSVEAVEAVIDRHRIDTVMLSPAIPMDQAPIEYFRRRYGEPETMEEMLIWRVRE